MNIKDYLHLYLGCEALYNGLICIIYQYNIFNNILSLDPPDGSSISIIASKEVKPILRPLSDMTEEEAVEFVHLKNRSILCNIDRTHITKISFGETKNIINFSYFKQRGSGAESGNKTYYVNQSDPEQFVYLLSKVFDLFNLIPAGLAIDKTKL